MTKQLDTHDEHRETPSRKDRGKRSLGNWFFPRLSIGVTDQTLLTDPNSVCTPLQLTAGHHTTFLKSFFSSMVHVSAIAPKAVGSER
jgi:hypothetical protein